MWINWQNLKKKSPPKSEYFLKLAYQPYKWLIVIPFLFTITLGMGLICIVEGWVWGQDGEVMPFKKGAFIFARKTGLPILPVTIKNSYKILPRDSLDLTPGTLDIIVHRPLYLSAPLGGPLTEIIEKTCQTISHALLKESSPPLSSPPLSSSTFLPFS